MAAGTRVGLVRGFLDPFFSGLEVEVDKGTPVRRIDAMAGNCHFKCSGGFEVRSHRLVFLGKKETETSRVGSAATLLVGIQRA